MMNDFLEMFSFACLQNDTNAKGIKQHLSTSAGNDEDNTVFHHSPTASGSGPSSEEYTMAFILNTQSQPSGLFLFVRCATSRWGWGWTRIVKCPVWYNAQCIVFWSGRVVNVGNKESVHQCPAGRAKGKLIRSPVGRQQCVWMWVSVCRGRSYPMSSQALKAH